MSTNYTQLTTAQEKDYPSCVESLVKLYCCTFSFTSAVDLTAGFKHSSGLLELKITFQILFRGDIVLQTFHFLWAAAFLKENV